MKKYLLAAAALMLAACAVYAETVVYGSLTPNSTSIQANTTNATAGTVYLLDRPTGSCRIYMTATGVAGTTGGSGLIVKFVTASGADGVTNAFDTASESAIKLTLTSLGANTFTISDRFDLTGVRYIKVGQVENTFGGAVSNLAFKISFPSVQ